MSVLDVADIAVSAGYSALCEDLHKAEEQSSA